MFVDLDSGVARIFTLNLVDRGLLSAAFGSENSPHVMPFMLPHHFRDSRKRCEGSTQSRLEDTCEPMTLDSFTLPDGGVEMDTCEENVPHQDKPMRHLACPSDYSPSPLSTFRPHSASSALLWNQRYFEKQTPMLARCGQHALNNLVGGPQFTVEDLSAAAECVCSESFEPRENHISSNGWYSHSVLATVLQNTVPPRWRLLLNPLSEDFLLEFITDPLVLGALVNQSNVHWIAVVKHVSRLWIVDSLTEPTLVSESALVELLHDHPNTFPLVDNDSVL